MENIQNLKEGVIIEGPFFEDRVKITKIENLGSDIRIEGYNLGNKEFVDIILSDEEVKNLKVIDDKKLFEADRLGFLLAMESLRYEYAYMNDSLIAINLSKVDPLPHQIEAVYGYILKNPRVRFLLADDPGAGKTIMTGLVIKELKLRQHIKRILIVCPGHLKYQWQTEMKDKFGEQFTIIDRNYFKTHGFSNPWDRENQIITSIDFIKRDEIRETLRGTSFDLVVVDEAHKLSAFKYGRKTEKSDRYRVGEILSEISTHMLFLTATPHRGDPENFRLFIDLLEPGFFANDELLKEAINKKENFFMLKRLKEDLKDFDGRPLFTPRHVRTVTFNLSEEEIDLYNELSRYVSTEYNKVADKDKRGNVAFALSIIQRRFASSIYALQKSLERRIKRLEELLENSKKQQKYADFWDEDFEMQIIDENEDENPAEGWEAITSAKNKQELEEEIKKLKSLIKKTQDLMDRGDEIKLSKLKSSLEELSKHSSPEDLKIIIFTESKDTMEYLTKNVKSWGYSVVNIHGQMSLDDRKDAEREFKENAQVLIATDAAGEGINLQFCNLMINYDIPWNPNRLEQRMGRIHRYGQTKEVFIHNLVNMDTREGKVLIRLFEKLEEMRKALGKDKVFDVIGEIIDDNDFAKVVVEAAVNARSIDEILKDIDSKFDQAKLEEIKQIIEKESLVTHAIDYDGVKQLTQKSREERLVPEYIEEFFKKAFEKAGGKVEKVSDGVLRVKYVPEKIRAVADDENFKIYIGNVEKSYSAITFYKEVVKSRKAEFVSFGHPLFEATLRWVRKEFGKVLQDGATFYDTNGVLGKSGYLLFYDGAIKDGTGQIAGRRLFTVFYPNQGEPSFVSPTILWDLDYNFKDNSFQTQTEPLETVKQKSASIVIQKLKEFKEEIQQERNRQADIKERYGAKSLELLIERLDDDILKLYGRKDAGEPVDIVIHNKEEQKKKYEINLKDLRDRIKREQSLTIVSPQLIGIARVVCLKDKDELRSDKEIERAGMDFVMSYEISCGRQPVDVSSYNLGYDIKSTDKDGNTRYIEVKARAEEGKIFLTNNELFAARKFGDDYYLYVVFNATTNPKLNIIQNPASRLDLHEAIGVVGYFVDKGQILNEGEDS